MGNLLATICNYDKNNGIKRLPGAVVSSTVWPWESKRSDFFGGWNRVESENIWSHPERGLRREGSCMLNYTVWSPTHRTTSVSDVLFSKMVTFIRRALPKNQLEGHVDFISTGVSEDCWPPNHGSAKHPKMVNLERTVGDNTHTHGLIWGFPQKFRQTRNEPHFFGGAWQLTHPQVLVGYTTHGIPSTSHSLGLFKVIFYFSNGTSTNIFILLGTP